MIWDELVCEKKKLDGENMPRITDELFQEYFRTGNRLNYENVYFGRRKFLTVYGIWCRFAKNRKEQVSPNDIERLRNIIKEIGEEKTWALPPHVNLSEPEWEKTVDLFAAETSFALAELCTLERDVLGDEICDYAKEQVMTRCLLPFMSADGEYAWWERSTMNWCAVCNGCVGAAGLYLLDEGEEKQKFIQRIAGNLQAYIQSFPADGICLEGMGYYYYAMGHLMAFVQLLRKKNIPHDILNDLALFEKIALFPQKCFLPGGYTVAFSDSSRKEKMRIGVQVLLSQYIDSVLIPEEEMTAGFHEDACYRYVLLSRDVEWENKVRENAYFDTAHDRFEFFPNAQWMVSVEGKSALAVKGGHNAEPHNHNDVGSFIYVADEELLIADLGSGEYTKDYFSDARYEQLVCRSMGHSVPIVGGHEQQEGEQCRAEDFCRINGGVEFQMKAAYPSVALINLRRNIRLENGKVTLCDIVNSGQAQELAENFITLLPVELEQDRIVICAKKRKYEITAAADTINGAPDIRKISYINHSGEKEFINRIQFIFPQKTNHRVLVEIKPYN